MNYLALFLFQFSMGCTSLEILDLSFCSSLCNSPSNEALWTLPTSLTDLSLSGVLLTDERILVECLQRLRNLKAVKLCGVMALNNDTLKEVTTAAFLLKLKQTLQCPCT